jgi:hypothetical protein
MIIRGGCAMKHRRLEISQIEVVVTGLFTTHHDLLTCSGSLGKLRFAAFSECGVLKTKDGRELVMQKPKMLSTVLEMTEGDTLRSTADRMGLLDQRRIIEYDGAFYQMQPEGLFKQGWFLVDHENHVLAEIQPRGAFKQGALITILGPVDADLIAFAYFVFYMYTSEQAVVVAATAS